MTIDIIKIGIILLGIFLSAITILGALFIHEEIEEKYNSNLVYLSGIIFAVVFLFSPAFYYTILFQIYNYIS